MWICARAGIPQMSPRCVLGILSPLTPQLPLRCVPYPPLTYYICMGFGLWHSKKQPCVVIRGLWDCYVLSESINSGLQEWAYGHVFLCTKRAFNQIQCFLLAGASIWRGLRLNSIWLMLWSCYPQAFLSFYCQSLRCMVISRNNSCKK